MNNLSSDITTPISTRDWLLLPPLWATLTNIWHYWSADNNQINPPIRLLIPWSNVFWYFLFRSFFSCRISIAFIVPYIRKTTGVIFHNMIPNRLTTTSSIDVRAPLVSSHELCYDFTSAAVVVSPSSCSLIGILSGISWRFVKLKQPGALGRKAGK